MVDYITIVRVMKVKSRSIYHKRDVGSFLRRTYDEDEAVAAELFCFIFVIRVLNSFLNLHPRKTIMEIKEEGKWKIHLLITHRRNLLLFLRRWQAVTSPVRP